MKTLIFIAFIFTVLNMNAQPWNMGTVGQQSTYSAGCPIVVSGSGNLFYDNGGPSGNYSNNINSIYQTFCPTLPGMAVQITFTQLITL